MMIAMITTVFAIQSAISLRADEASGIIEPQLAGRAVAHPLGDPAPADPGRRVGASCCSSAAP